MNLDEEIIERFGNSVKVNEFPICPKCHQQKWSKINQFYKMCPDCIDALRKNPRGQSVKKERIKKKTPENPSYFQD